MPVNEENFIKENEVYSISKNLKGESNGLNGCLSVEKMKSHESSAAGR